MNTKLRTRSFAYEGFMEGTGQDIFLKFKKTVFEQLNVHTKHIKKKHKTRVLKYLKQF